MTAPRFVIGQCMQSVEDFAAAPVGTTVTLPTDRQNYTWVKEADQWRNTSHLGNRSHQRMYDGSNTSYTITELPAETVDDARPAIGSTVVVEQVNHLLPVGTVVYFYDHPSRNAPTPSDYSTCIKRGPTEWTREGERLVDVPLSGFSRPCIVQSYPDQFQFTVGQQVNSHEMIAALPLGTVIGYTRDNLGELFEKLERGWVHVQGGETAQPIEERRATADNHEWWTRTNRWFIESLPGVTPGPVVVQPVPETVVAGPAVGTRMTVEIAGQCQVGTEISRPSGGTEIYRKVETDQWAEVRGNGTYGSYRAQNFDFARYEWLILSVPTPPVPAEVQQELNQMQVRIRQCIDDAVIQQRGYTGRVRDGAWIKLGWDPAPARGTTIHARTAYGLANNSLVEQNGKLFRIDDERAWPERYQTDGTRHNVDFQSEGDVTVVWAETAPLPVYYSANDLLNKFWVIYDKMRARESWCGYVNDCLHGNGLNNPGEQPQQFTQVEAPAPELPPLVFTVGQSIDCSPMRGAELERHRAAFLALPEGSVARGNQSGRLYVKTQGGWVESRDLSPAFRTGDSVPFVTIEFIAGDDEPADQPF